MTEFYPDPDNAGWFIGIVSPSPAQDLRQVTARRAYYHRRHVERWMKRYGKSYPELDIKLGTFLGMRFIE